MKNKPLEDMLKILSHYDDLKLASLLIAGMDKLNKTKLSQEQKELIVTLIPISMELYARIESEAADMASLDLAAKYVLENMNLSENQKEEIRNHLKEE